MTVRAPVLIVEDLLPLASMFIRLIDRRAPARHAGTAADARIEFQTAIELSAAIVDVSLPDGSGLDVLEAFRPRHPRVPVLVVTGSIDRVLVNRAQLLGTEFACKPEELEGMKAFLDRVLGPTNDMADDADPRREGLIAARTTSLGLTPKEEQILRLELIEMPRKQMARELGLSEDAIKRIARGIAEKADGMMLATIAREIRAELMKK